VCSTLPAIRRPPGPRNDRSIDDTSPNVTRTPPPRVAASHLAPAQVVRIGHDLTVGGDDAGSATVAADADDRCGDGVCDRPNGGSDLFDGTHSSGTPRLRVAL
jgi:hypothetical protein